MRFRTLPSPMVMETRTESEHDTAELQSISTHVKVDKPSPDQLKDFRNDSDLQGEDGISGEALSARLRREKAVLLCEVNSSKAKFDLTMQTLRSILRLDATASWADVLEAVESLARNPSRVGASLGKPEEEEVELEKEQLEDRLEASEEQCSRLSDLLQRQQKLLDLTASQMADHFQESQRQAEHVSGLELEKSSYEETNAALASKVDTLTAACAKHQEESQTQRDLARSFEEQAHAEMRKLSEEQDRCQDLTSQIAELKEQLAAREGECKRYRVDSERQNKVIKDLTEGLACANAANDRSRQQLQVYEAADRRTFSYAPRSPKAIDDNASTMDAVGSPCLSARGSEAALNVPVSARGKPKASASKQMDDAERDAFLSQFPMASRTERLLRNRLEHDKRAKLVQH